MPQHSIAQRMQSSYDAMRGEEKNRDSRDMFVAVQIDFGNLIHSFSFAGIKSSKQMSIFKTWRQIKNKSPYVLTTCAYRNTATMKLLLLKAQSFWQWLFIFNIIA